MQNAVRKIPMDRLLVETDSPYLRNGKVTTNTPNFIGDATEVVARITGITVQEICHITTDNVRRLYDV